MDWCCQNPGKCDKAFRTACMEPSNQRKLECACFLPPEFYERLSEKMRALLPGSSIVRPICSYSRCAQSPIQPAIREQCPDVSINNVHCSVNIDNEGTIKADIMDMDINCEVKRPGPDGASANGDQEGDTNKPETPANVEAQWLVPTIIIVCITLLLCIVILYMWYKHR